MIIDIDQLIGARPIYPYICYIYTLLMDARNEKARPERLSDRAFSFVGVPWNIGSIFHGTRVLESDGLHLMDWGVLKGCVVSIFAVLASYALHL